MITIDMLKEQVNKHQLSFTPEPLDYGKGIRIPNISELGPANHWVHRAAKLDGYKGKIPLRVGAAETPTLTLTI